MTFLHIYLIGFLMGANVALFVEVLQGPSW